MKNFKKIFSEILIGIVGFFGTTIDSKIGLGIFLLFLGVASIFIETVNFEGEIIGKIQENDFDALIINPGAFTHYSYAIADALKNLRKPKIEVHISNIYQREEFRQKSVTAAYTDAVLSGFGTEGYRLAIIHLISTIQ